MPNAYEVKVGEQYLMLEVDDKAAESESCCCTIEPPDPGPTRCSGGQVPSVDLQLAGVLGCDTCATGFPLQANTSIKWRLINADGTYTLPFAGFVNGRCRYRLFVGAFDPQVLTAEMENHNDATCSNLFCVSENISGQPTAGLQIDFEVFLVEDLPNGLKVDEIRAWDLFFQGGDCDGFVSSSLFSWAGSVPRNTFVPNQLAGCNDPQIASVTGMAQVQF